VTLFTFLKENHKKASGSDIMKGDKDMRTLEKKRKNKQELAMKET